MKFLPGFSLFDDVFDDSFGRSFLRKSTQNMKTDISEKDGNYILNMELPGYAKDDIKISLSDGYLTVRAVKDAHKEEKDDKGNIIRQERYSGSCQRSFYVGDGVREEDVKAKHDNGELQIIVPKKDTKKVEEDTYIAIE